MTTTNVGALNVRVDARREEATDIVSFELVSIDGTPLPSFSAGSHLDVKIGEGLVRQYSLCNDPSESHRYQIAVLKDPNSRGGSRAVHERIQVGSQIEISAPKNHFQLVHEARRTLLLAGGIGVTPILCMAERLSMLQASFEMHYCARSPERAAFRKRIETSPFASHVKFHFDDGASEQKLNIGSLLAAQDDDVHLYVCGPKGFMDAVLAGARAAGWPEKRLHYEFFSAAPVATQDNESFEVQIASSGKIVVVPKDQTVLQALINVGISIPVSCEQGVCGTCLTRVLEGVPDHKDLYLTPDEQAVNDQFTPCCSRSKSPRLILDL